MTIRLPLASLTPKPGLRTDSSPPGAQAPIHAASSTSWKSSRPVPPKQVQPSPSSCGVLLLRRRDLLGGDLEQDHVVDDLGVAGQHGRAGEPGVALELGVEQEAAVVVGARAVRRGGGVRRRHREGLAALALAQRHLRGRLGGRDRRGPSWRTRTPSGDVSVAAASVASWPSGCSSSVLEHPVRTRTTAATSAAASRALIRAATGANARRARAGGRGRRSARRRRRC